VNAVPPGIEAPAAGIVKRTSASTRGQDASRKKTALDGRIAKVCALSVKRMTCCRVRFCGRIIVMAIGKVGIRCDGDVLINLTDLGETGFTSSKLQQAIASNKSLVFNLGLLVC
jgi:hypothetical protein